MVLPPQDDDRPPEMSNAENYQATDAQRCTQTYDSVALLSVCIRVHLWLLILESRKGAKPRRKDDGGDWNSLRLGAFA
jgi:hypothetical protein